MPSPARKPDSGRGGSRGLSGAGDDRVCRSPEGVEGTGRAEAPHVSGGAALIRGGRLANLRRGRTHGREVQTERTFAYPSNLDLSSKTGAGSIDWSKKCALALRCRSAWLSCWLFFSRRFNTFIQGRTTIMTAWFMRISIAFRLCRPSRMDPN